MSISTNYTIEADTERKIVREKIYGIWKEETARLYHDDFVKEASGLINGKWGKIIDLRNWKSSYPEVVDIIGKHLRWCAENRMVLSVNIIENPVTLSQLKRMFTLGGTREISKVFRSVKEGDRFLKKAASDLVF